MMEATKWLWFHAIIIVFLFSFLDCECEGCLEQERTALLQLKRFFNHSDVLRNWVDVKPDGAVTELDCCMWERVDCNVTSRRVIQLSLDFLRPETDDEYLNVSLFLPFEELKSLYLDRNGIAGFVGNKGGGNQFPITLEILDLSLNKLKNDSLTYLSGLLNLKLLNIGDNILKGSIDIKELNSLKTLKKLDMSGNRIECLQSFQDGQRKLMLMNLEELDLSENLINDSIFGPLSELSNLKSLNIRGNGLKGAINIKGWCDLRRLEWLDLSENAFEGILPPCLGNLSSLRYLDVSYNQFTGNSSSTSLTNLTSLRFIDLSNNHFQVPSIFEAFANHSHLEVLLSDQNQFVKVPQTWTPQFQLNVFTMSNCTSTDSWEQLPEFLHYQYKLSLIDLSYNKIGGRFPTWLFENNSMLEVVFLMRNALDGSLNLPLHPNSHIFELDISSNSIHGNIPSNICSIFPHLVELQLSRNALKGVIPPCLGELVILDLSHNGLSGGIPEEFGKSNSLRILRLSDNNLSGKLFPTIFGIRSIYLDGNKFDGELPLINISRVSSSDRPYFSRVDSSVLYNIDLSNNHLSGKLPSWIWNMSTLGVLALSNNHLEGPIPKEACYLEELDFLDLSQNYFSGPLPSCINPPGIRHVHLGRNRLSGPLTRAFFVNDSTVTLDLSENNFSGEIPPWIGDTSLLTVLLLKANNLSGEIPDQLCNLDSLSIIDLSQNKLSGIIPSCLSKLTLDSWEGKSFINEGYLVGFSLHGEEIPYTYSNVEGPGDKLRRFGFSSYPGTYVEEQVNFMTKKGSYTYKGNILDYMSGIDLSCNRLTGLIPIELGNLSEIRSLNLSHNNLRGLIPSSFSKLKQIESLDLSHNNLNGEIPIQLIELNALAVFNVSYNNLSGSIPSQKAQFGTFDESTYVGNDLLCGPPLHKNCTIDSHPTVQIPFNGEEPDGFMDPYVFYVTFLVSYAAVLVGIAVIFYINPYWRQVWFNFIQKFIDSCNFLVVDNLLKFSIFRRMYSTFCL